MNVNQLMLSTYPHWSEVIVRYTSCMPVTGVVLTETVVQDCQPPVFVTAKPPIGALVRLSSLMSTRAFIFPMKDATRAKKRLAGIVEPKSTFLYSTQAPPAIEPMSWPPPVSEHVSGVMSPDWAE